MYGNIESMLLAQQAELYLSIKQKSTCELNLPINVGNSIVGFGKILDFYMFWISEKRGTVCFNARKKFVRSRMDNSFSIEFIKENQNAIFEAIDKIYNSYFESKTNGELEKETQRIEDKNSIRTTLTKNKEKGFELELLWNDITVLTLENFESTYCERGDINKETARQLNAYGERLVELFDDALNVLVSKYYPSKDRKIPIYREYIESDERTLADIALNYNVTRERIRQIVKQVDERIFRYFKRMLCSGNAEFYELIEKLAAVFKAVGYNAAHLIGYGFENISNRKKQAVFNMLFGKAFSQRLMTENQKTEEYIKTQNTLAEKDKAILEAWDFYQSKILYPSNLVADQSIKVASYEKELRFNFEKRFFEKIKKFESIIEIVQDPDIIYYSTSQTDHRPHFLLRLPDGTSVLVLVLPTVNMAFIYNIERCNALHRYCKENGYGYLVIDDRENSIYDVRNREIDPALLDSLNALLEKQSMIVWKNIKEIKLKRPVSNADIAAYVLQNKLHFTMKPFCIKRR